jgi:hypothetical protein
VQLTRRGEQKGGDGELAGGNRERQWRARHGDRTTAREEEPEGGGGAGAHDAAHGGLCGGLVALRWPNRRQRRPATVAGKKLEAGAPVALSAVQRHQSTRTTTLELLGMSAGPEGLGGRVEHGGRRRWRAVEGIWWRRRTTGEGTESEGEGRVSEATRGEGSGRAYPLAPLLPVAVSRGDRRGAAVHGGDDSEARWPVGLGSAHCQVSGFGLFLFLLFSFYLLNRRREEIFGHPNSLGKNVRLSPLNPLYF